MGKYDELVERLKAQAESASRASIALAEAKSARQGDNPEGALDLYEWLLPAETIEWQAAAAIATLEAELETLRPQVKVADDQWDAKCDELAAMKARGDRLAEAGKNLLSACYEADGYEELPEQIDGSLLDAMSLAIWPEIWTDEQVAALNAYQARDDSHPFTCGSDNRGDEAHRAVQDEDGGDLGQLVATRQGWICPACDYRQFWAHDFMFAQALTELRDQHHGGNDADT